MRGRGGWAHGIGDKIWQSWITVLFSPSSAPPFLSISKLDVSSGIGGCPMPSEVKFDTIFIDIAGLRQFKSVVKARLQHYQ